MTLSFVGATVLSLLLLEFVFGSLTWIFSQRQSLLTIMTNGEIFRMLLGFVASGFFWALVAATAGVLLGFLTTSTSRRIRRLVDVPARCANSDYSQRVSETISDEIGQLERQLNTMDYPPVRWHSHHSTRFLIPSKFHLSLFTGSTQVAILHFPVR